MKMKFCVNAPPKAEFEAESHSCKLDFAPDPTNIYEEETKQAMYINGI